MHRDPALFDLANADSETLALNEQLERLTLAIPSPLEDGVEAWPPDGRAGPS